MILRLLEACSSRDRKLFSHRPITSPEQAALARQKKSPLTADLTFVFQEGALH
jgi:hypothetical protein